jgi:hypothetical protein
MPAPPAMVADLREARPSMAPVQLPPAPAPQRAFRPPSAEEKKGAPMTVGPAPPAIVAEVRKPMSRMTAAQPAPMAAPPPPALQAAAKPSGSAGRIGAGADKLEAQAQNAPPRAKDLFYQNLAGFRQGGSSFDRKAKSAETLREKELEQAQELGLRYSLVRRGANGRYAEVPLDTLLPSGESAHLRLEANQAGYLYVMADRGALFSGPVQPHHPAEVSVRAGTLHLILLRGPASGPLSTLVARTRRQVATQQLSVERGAANYAVNSSAAPDAVVLADVVVNIR